MKNPALSWNIPHSSVSLVVISGISMKKEPEKAPWSVPLLGGFLQDAGNFGVVVGTLRGLFGNPLQDFLG